MREPLKTEREVSVLFYRVLAVLFQLFLDFQGDLAGALGGSFVTIFRCVDLESVEILADCFDELFHVCNCFKG